MKFNTKLKLPEWIKLVDEIVDGNFDPNTGEYIPHIGEIHTAYLYFKHCVTADDGEEITPENIDDDGDVDFEKLEAIMNNHVFAESFMSSVIYSYDEWLTFGNAYNRANEIIESRVRNGGLFVQRIINGIGNIADAFSESVSEENIDKLVNALNDIKDGKISSEAIAEAYANSDRFKQNTEDSKIIELPIQK